MKPTLDVVIYTIERGEELQAIVTRWNESTQIASLAVFLEPGQIVGDGGCGTLSNVPFDPSGAPGTFRREVETLARDKTLESSGDGYGDRP
jgi:hypothetical protein